MAGKRIVILKTKEGIRVDYGTVNSYVERIGMLKLAYTLAEIDVCDTVRFQQQNEIEASKDASEDEDTA